MRYQQLNAAKMRAELISLGVKSAESMSDEEACRLYSRVKRGSRAGVPTSMMEAIKKGSQQARARNTHRGKR